MMKTSSGRSGATGKVLDRVSKQETNTSRNISEKKRKMAIDHRNLTGNVEQ